jgi:hypothetical protein
MSLVRGTFRGYEYNRMVVLFTMMDEQAEIICAISTLAMDDLDGSSGTAPERREAQFLRLRDRIEERAARKFSDAELEGRPPGIVLRSVDFRAEAGSSAKKNPALSPAPDRSPQISVDKP